MKELITFISAIAVVLFAAIPGISAKTVSDGANRTVRVPDDPKRVVALAPSVTEIIFALGQESRLKGVTIFSDYPPEAAKIPKVGSYVHLDLEKIVALKPDLCIAVKDGNPIAVVKRLEALGIPVYAVDPIDFNSVMTAIAGIGGLLNCSDRSSRLVASLTKRVGAVRRALSNTETRPAVFFQIGISPIVSAGPGTFIDELIMLAGGRNIVKSPAYPRFSREQVISLLPEIIIITTMARQKGFEEAKADWLSWPQLPAVRNNRIFLVDSDIVDRPTPRLVTGLEKIAKLIHPNLFEKEKTE